MTVKQAYEIIFGKTNQIINENYIRNNLDQVKLRIAHHKIIQKFHPDISSFAKTNPDMTSEISKEINIANDILKKCLLDKQYIHYGSIEKLIYDDFVKILKQEELKQAKLMEKRLTKAINTYKYYMTISIINNNETYYEKINNAKNLEETFKIIIEYQNKALEIISNLEEKDRMYQRYKEQTKEKPIPEDRIKEILGPYYETLDNKELEELISSSFEEKQQESASSIKKIEILINDQEKRYIKYLEDIKDAYILLKTEEIHNIIIKAYDYFKIISKEPDERDLINLENYLNDILKIEETIESTVKVYNNLSIEFLFRNKNKPLFTNIENYHKCIDSIFEQDEDGMAKVEKLLNNPEEYQKRKVNVDKSKQPQDRKKETMKLFYQEYKDEIIEIIKANFYLYKVIYEDRVGIKPVEEKSMTQLYKNIGNLSITELKKMSKEIENNLNKEVKLINPNVYHKNK